MNKWAIPTAQERYLTDYAFNRVVDTVSWAIRYHRLSGAEVQDAITLAMQHAAESSRVR